MPIVDYNYSTYQEVIRDLLADFQNYEQIATYTTELWITWINEAQEVISTFTNIPRTYSLPITAGTTEYDLTNSNLKQVAIIRRTNGRIVNVVPLDLMYRVQYWDTLLGRNYKTDEVPFWAAEKVEVGMPKKLVIYPTPTANDTIILMGYLGFVAKFNTDKGLTDTIALGSIYNDLIKLFVKMRLWENLELQGADVKATQYKNDFYQLLVSFAPGGIVQRTERWRETQESQERPAT